MVDEQLHIRVATQDDIEAMMDLVQTLFAIETDFEFFSGKTRDGLGLLLARPDQARVMVAEYLGDIVGMGTLQLLISTAEGGVVGLLEDMVVDENWRGRGVGRLLLQSLERWGIAHGVRRLQLLADRQNRPALSFYAALGWSATELVALRRYPDTDAAVT
ncbi:MAG: GNAT family N-acetyltransferase [Granulosicoccaceae bacterium]|jgi:GNAT superfamily N-acetyltransferase